MYPILSLFGFSFGTYGICCVIGGALAIWLAIRNGKRFQQDRFAMLEACVWALIGGFLGATALSYRFVLRHRGDVPDFRF